MHLLGQLYKPPPLVVVFDYQKFCYLSILSTDDNCETSVNYIFSMKKKICICIDSLRIGGAERLVIDLINHWSNEWKIYLATFFDRNDLIDTLNKDNLEDHIIFGTDCSRYDAIIRMYKFCKQNNIDIVLCHLERPNKWLAIGARLSGSGVINTVHNINIYDQESILKKISIKILYNIVPHEIIAISDTVKQYLINLGVKGDKINVILNGVDTYALKAKYSTPTPQQNLDLVVLSRLEPVKAIDIVLAALAQLDTEGWQWSLRIIGDGSQRNALQDISHKLNIAGKIEFIGAQSDPLCYLLDRSAICMPSYREGLPLAILEALTIGLPAIVSNVGYLPKIVSDGTNGFICKAGSVESLLVSLRKLGSLSPEQWLNFSHEAQNSAKKYDIRACVNGYQEVANTLI